MKSFVIAIAVLLASGLAQAETVCQPDDLLRGSQLAKGWTSCTTTLRSGDKVRIIKGAPISTRTTALVPAPRVAEPARQDIRVQVVLPNRVFLPNRAVPRIIGRQFVSSSRRFLRDRRPRRVRY